ncbi:hypothetical protein POTOM_051455 [Populus tomentosa]|uniref:NADH-ubiquinone oxidoreductase ESSS subunit n=1 Tax=Populus tomentosa TaxID=118781 RepID=A0A8X8C891_POPTO|nr:hypothetical protein POTOM_051455 [Populus tomentosa]
MPFTTASSMLRHRISSALRTRGGAKAGPSRWISPGHEEQPKGHFLNRTPPPPGESRKWEDWELPCYITSFLTIVILGVGLNAKPDLTIETWAHQKALERLQMEKLGLSGSADSDILIFLCQLFGELNCLCGCTLFELNLSFDCVNVNVTCQKDAICYCGNYITQPGCGVSLSRAQYAYNHYLMRIYWILDVHLDAFAKTKLGNGEFVTGSCLGRQGSCRGVWQDSVLLLYPFRNLLAELLKSMATCSIFGDG